MGDIGMFMGEFRHNIDTKGRLTLPSKFRDAFDASVVVTRGFDGCLNVYSLDQWQKVFEKLQRMPTNKKEARTFVRLFTAKASEIEFDKLGRINLPKPLVDEGHLEKECVIVGVGDHVEIWNAEAWDDYYNDEKDNFEDISESLEDFEF